MLTHSSRLIDRIAFAAALSKGKRTLDIGGQKMAGTQAGCPYARAYSKIAEAASEYKIVDYQKQPTVDYVIDFNKPESIPEIKEVLRSTKPDVVLCMEMLEHVNYHFELLNAIAETGAEAFITVPNNKNWLFEAFGWNNDHSIAFFRDIAVRFIARSSFGGRQITVYPCFGQYRWWWRLAYTAAFCQPIC